MAATVSITRTTNAGTQQSNLSDIALDNNYPTGGYELKASDFILSQINRLKTTSGGNYLFIPDYTNAPASVKLKVYDISAGTFTPTALPTETIAVRHNATPSASATPLYAVLNPLDATDCMLVTDINEIPDVYPVQSAPSFEDLPIYGYSTESVDMNITYNADPVANLAASRLYFRVTQFSQQGVLGVFTSDLDNTATIEIEDSGNNLSFTVLYDANVATDPMAIPLTFTEGATDGLRILGDMAFGSNYNYYVQANDNSHFLQIANGTGTTLLYVDDNAGNPEDRLVSTQASTNTVTNATNTLNGVRDVLLPKSLLTPVYCDPTASAEDRFLCNFVDLFGRDRTARLLNGRLVNLVYDLNASTNGYLVYANGGAGVASLIYNNTATGTDTAVTLNSTSTFITGLASGAVTGGGSLTEVSNGTDLSSVVVKAEAYGF